MPETTRACSPRCATSTPQLGVTIVIVSHELSVLGDPLQPRRRHRDGAIAEEFALDDPASLAAPRKTALGANWRSITPPRPFNRRGSLGRCHV
jgi:D-methionine transport system ATP-binding protein